MNKGFWPIFSGTIEHDKRQGATYKRPEGNLTITVFVIGYFFKDQRVC